MNNQSINISHVANRCPWAGNEPLYIKYHDEEWGKPLYDERALFAMLCLEGAQAGLSWWTVLQKRAHYCEVFDQFDPNQIAQYDQKKRDALMSDAGIIRNRLKINAFIENAKSYLRITQNQTFTHYLWQFVDGEPIINHHKNLNTIPAQTIISEKMSKQLKKDGFRFVGPTICYAFMQATGMVCDHLITCPQHPDNLIV